jgi:hypothetical protein
MTSYSLREEGRFPSKKSPSRTQVLVPERGDAIAAAQMLTAVEDRIMVELGRAGVVHEAFDAVEALPGAMPRRPETGAGG